MLNPKIYYDLHDQTAKIPPKKPSYKPCYTQRTFPPIIHHSERITMNDKLQFSTKSSIIGHTWNKIMRLVIDIQIRRRNIILARSYQMNQQTNKDLTNKRSWNILSHHRSMERFLQDVIVSYKIPQHLGTARYFRRIIQDLVRSRDISARSVHNKILPRSWEDVARRIMRVHTNPFSD